MNAKYTPTSGFWNENRAKRRTHKNYFLLSDEVLTLYQNRGISAVDAVVISYLYSARNIHTDILTGEKSALYGVRVCQERIAFMCGITPKTVAASVSRLYDAGVIENVITERKKRSPKYKTSIYILKPLPVSDRNPAGSYFFVPRSAFNHDLKPKEFVLVLDFCRQHSFEFGKSWNSYNDICERLGFNKKNQRSEVARLVAGLVNRGIVGKKVRRVKKVFVDNIYSIANYAKEVAKKIVRNFGEACDDFRDVRVGAMSAYRAAVEPIYESGVQLTLLAENGFADEFEGFPF